VLVQLDDELVARLDALAEQIGVSRSELLRRGAEAALTAAELTDADSLLVAAYQRQPQDPLFVASALHLAANTALPH
jgi:metal-responsive CopG/Arc/MetJ family transcriptional regulator